MINPFLFAAAEAEGASTLVDTEIAAVVLIAIAAGVAVFARRFEFPFTVALVLAGFGATALGELVAVDISADLILFLLVPPLLFEATLHIHWPQMKSDLMAILLMALAGTAIGTVAIAWLVHVGLSLSWPAAFAFGALISATDPVAVVAFFKSLGAPDRLGVLVEGESLFNDAVAVVAFGLAIAVAEGEAFSVGGALTDFLVISLGGIAVGLVMGFVVSEVILANVDDGLIETATTMALAYGSFLVAEEFGAIVGQDFHFSGILAVVVAGLVQGTVGVHNTSPSTRVTIEHSWELLSFLVNSLVFLFIGLTISPRTLFGRLDVVLIAVVGVLVLRLVLVYSLSWISGRLRPAKAIPFNYQHVIFWGGLRGAISLALALTISDKVFDPETVETIRVMTFGVVLFTLLVQGLTIGGLIRRLGLAGKDKHEIELQHHQARLVMGRAGQAEIARLGSDGVIDNHMADAFARAYSDDMAEHATALSLHTRAHPEMEASMLYQARREAIVAERSALKDVVHTGLIEGHIAKDVVRQMNNRMVAIDIIEDRFGSELHASHDISDLEDKLELAVAEELGWLRSVSSDTEHI